MKCKCGENIEERKRDVNIIYNQGSSIRIKAKCFECNKCKEIIIKEVDLI